MRRSGRDWRCPPATPLTALLHGEILAQTELPADVWSAAPMANDVAAELIRDPRLPLISFTGPVPVGWSIREAAPRPLGQRPLRVDRAGGGLGVANQEESARAVSADSGTDRMQLPRGPAAPRR